VAEKPGLFDGLRCASAAKGCRPVGGDGHQRPALIEGFDDGREKFRCGGAAGGDDGARQGGFQGATKGKKPGAAFFEMAPYARQTARLRTRQRF